MKDGKFIQILYVRDLRMTILLVIVMLRVCKISESALGIVSWNALIGGYVKHDVVCLLRHKKFLKSFLPEMSSLGMLYLQDMANKGNVMKYCTVLNTCKVRGFL